MISSLKRSQIISERAPNYLFWIEIDSQHEKVLNYFRNSLKLFLLNWNWFPVWILSHSVRPIYRRQRPPVNASTNIVLFGNNTSYKAATSIKTTTDKISIQYNILIPWQLTNRAGIQLSFKYAAIYKILTAKISHMTVLSLH